ncbi:MAG: septum formation protein Maf [Chloroflexi bacterium RBG_19FT_COMBO_47_15]|nr:MAG: septum formation protein Maf [Chloroflexi bacterium RBG_19FT_COMBO_47_15]
MKKIILASGSPRRKELLEKIGLKFEVESSNYEEDIYPGLQPHDVAQKISLKKAEIVASKHKNVVIIAADTFIVFDGQILGKPSTVNESRKMLQKLNGKSHSVITGFSVIDTAKNKTLSRSVETIVFLKKLTPSEIDTYVKSKEPLDKAGGYAIQGLGAVIVDRIEGDYLNVVGLPLSALTEALKEFGIHIL